MIKAAVTITILLIFSFFAGVNYSEAIKKNYSWVFETEDLTENSRVELPAITDKNVVQPKKLK